MAEKINIERALLTSDDQEDQLYKVAGRKFINRGRLFPATTEFYDHLNNDKELLAAAKLLYRWLGVKPYQLHVTFCSETDSVLVDESGTISIPAYLATFPYQTGAALALGVCQHFLYNRHKLSPDTVLLEEATVVYGFGILVLNGLRPHAGIFERASHLIHGHWQVHTVRFLQTQSEANYARAVQGFTDANQLSGADYLPLLQKRARRLLPKKTYVRSLNELRPALPKVLVSHRQHARTMWLRFGLIGLFLALILSTGLYVLAQRPIKPSQQTLDLYAKIIDLKKQYDACENDAQNKQKTLNVNDDIFMQQQVDATLSHCASLRNEYNFNVQTYNQNVGR